MAPRQRQDESTWVPSVQHTDSARTGELRCGSSPVALRRNASTMNNPFQSFTINLGPISPPAHTPQDQERLHALMQEGRWSELEQAARAMTQRNPSSALGWKALGLSLHRQGQLDEALQPTQQAAKLAPHDPESFNNLGALISEGEHQQHAEACFRRALQLQAHHIPALENLITLLGKQGRHAELPALLAHRLTLEPDNDHVRHQLAMVSGQQTDSAPAGYVQQVFDQYADRFDDHLVGELHYQVPQQLSAWLIAAAPDSPPWRVIDLGCGTGLVGEHLQDHCEELIGIDLSGRMLDKARERGAYTRLEQADVAAQLQQEPPGRYDAIVAADVFIYVGKLDAVMAHARRALKPGGWLAFSVESMASAHPPPGADDNLRGHRLEPTGRYTHGAAYLAQLARAHGFTIVRQEEVTLREEQHQPVTGQLHLWRC